MIIAAFRETKLLDNLGMKFLNDQLSLAVIYTWLIASILIAFEAAENLELLLQFLSSRRPETESHSLYDGDRSSFCALWEFSEGILKREECYFYFEVIC